MASTSTSKLNDLLNNTDLAQQQGAKLEYIKVKVDEIVEELKKGVKLSPEKQKAFEKLKEQIIELNKEGSVTFRKELAPQIAKFVELAAEIKKDWSDYADDIQLSYLNLDFELQETMKESQVLFEKKLNEVGEYIGGKINIAVEFVGTKIKESINNALNTIGKNINAVFSNLAGDMKDGFSKLKNTLLHPLETLKNLPGQILGFLKSGIMMIYNGIKGLVKLAYNVIVGALRIALTGIVKIFKGIVWVVSKIFQGLYWVVKQVFWLVYKGLAKIFSFLASVVWGLLKTVGTFILSVMWKTIKTIASTVIKVAWTIGTTLIKSIVMAIMTALGPWLGILLLVGIGIYLLARYVGFWAGNKDSQPNKPEKGGLFSAMLDVIKGWWESIKGYLWNEDGTGIINKAWSYLWNDEGTGWLNISGEFFKSLWDKLLDFGEWLLVGSENQRNKKKDRINEIYDLVQKEEVKRKYDPDYSAKEQKKLEDEQKKLLQEVAKSYEGKNAFFGGIIPQIIEWWNGEKGIQLVMHQIYEILYGKQNNPNDKGIIGWLGKALTGYPDWAWDSPDPKSLLGKLYNIVFGTSNMNWSNPTSESLLGKLYELIFGKNSINWGSPTPDSLLGKLYELVFGKSSVDWSTNTGLLGGIKIFMLENVAVPILDFLADKILKSIKDLMVTVGVYLQKIGFKETGQIFASAGHTIGRGADEVSRIARKTSALVSGGKINELQKEREDIETSGEERTEEQQVRLSVIATEISKLEKSREENIKLSDPKILEQKEQIKSEAEWDIEDLSRYLYSFGLTSLNFRTAFRNKDTRVNLGEILFNDWAHLFAFDNPKNMDGSSWIVTKFSSDIKDYNIRKYAGDHKQFEWRTNEAIKHFTEGEKLGIFTADDRANLNKLIQAATTTEMDQTMGYEAFKQSGSMAIYKGYTKEQYLDEMGTPRWNWIWGGTSKEKTEHDVFGKYVPGMAMGGIIMPPTAQANMGRIITVAEAGDPEIVLPLNAQGIKYIKDISETIHPVKEHSDFIGNLVDGLKEIMGDKVEINNKKTKNPALLPAINVKNSDSAQLDLIKLVSLGVLSK